MLHPNSLRSTKLGLRSVSESAPIRTETDGEFNCFVLTDAASCFILSSELIPVTDANPLERSSAAC